MEITEISEELREHYDKMRVKKNNCEKIYGCCMALMILFGVVEILITNTFADILELAAGNIIVVIATAAKLAALAVSIIGLYKRSWKLTAIAIFLLLIAFLVQQDCTCIGTLVTLIVTEINHCTWEKLKKAEGFPHFEITEVEQQQRLEMEKQVRLHTEGEKALLDKTARTNLPQCSAKLPKPEKPGEMDTI